MAQWPRVTSIAVTSHPDDEWIAAHISYDGGSLDVKSPNTAYAMLLAAATAALKTESLVTIDPTTGQVQINT